jgi:hypothetical protein
LDTHLGGQHHLCNICLLKLSFQRGGSRPEIIFNRLELHDPYNDGILSLGMLNVGTRTAYNYRLDIKTVSLTAGTVVEMAFVNAANPIRRQAGAGAEPRLPMDKFLEVMALCASYQDDDDNKFQEVDFVAFPTLTRGLKKDKGGGGVYPAASVGPEDFGKLAAMKVCAAASN